MHDRHSSAPVALDRGSNYNVSVPALVGTLPPQCKQDLDALCRYVRNLLTQETLVDPVSPAQFQEVLLTGATGFVGRYFLRDLLRQKSELIVHCVVRAGTTEQGFGRLRDAMEQAGIWDETLAPRIRVIIGDLAQDRFGLSDADFDGLCQRIDAVYHLAADVSLARSYSAIRDLNTLVIQQITELCVRRRFKHLFFASTMGIFPQYIAGFAHEFRFCPIDDQAQPDLASMKRMYPMDMTGYPWSKLVCEQVLLFAQAAGMPLGIFRLPQTAIATNGFVQPDDTTFKILGAILDCGVMPTGFSFRSNHEVVDVLSRACTAISLNPARLSTIYQCCNPKLDRHDLGLADYGVYLPEVSYEAFKRACQVRSDSPLRGLWPVLDQFQKYWFTEVKPKGIQLVSDRAFREDCPYPIRWMGAVARVSRTFQWHQEQSHQWPYPVLHGRLDFDQIIARAKHYADAEGVSFDEVYPVWMRRNLEQLIRAVKRSDIKLLDTRKSSVVFIFNQHLLASASFARDRKLHPEIGREKISNVVFIVGLNRTGTSLLHRLMARDERFWTLRSYEYAVPILSKKEYATIGGTADDPRRIRAMERVEDSGLNMHFKGIHHFDVDEPAEDFPILSMSFGSWTDTVRFQIPEYGDWLDAAGSAHSYAYHRRIMQNITWQRRQRQSGSGGQWLFKMPFHLMELEALLEVYPDALFIQTHRSPDQLMGSWCSFVDVARTILSGSQSGERLGAELLTFMSGMMDRCIRFREMHPELEHRWMDLNYVDLVKDPLGTVRSIYERFNWPFSQGAAAAMDSWLRQQMKRRSKEPKHRYELKDYGLTSENISAAFADYFDFVGRRGLPITPTSRQTAR